MIGNLASTCEKEEINCIYPKNNTQKERYADEKNNNRYSQSDRKTLQKWINQKKIQQNTKKPNHNMIQETLTEYDIQSKNGKWKNHYNLILDNYSIHKSKFTKPLAIQLNINLIDSPPYSPQLNHIKQV